MFVCMQMHKCIYAAWVCSGGRKRICSFSRRSSPGQVHYLFNSIRIYSFVRIGIYELQTAPPERKTCMHSKKRKKKNICTHTRTVFFFCLFSQIKMWNTTHTFSSQVVFKWQGDGEPVEKQKKQQPQKRQRHAVTAEQDAEPIQSKGQRLAEAGDKHANSAAWDCCNYDNIVSRGICLGKKLNWGSSVKACRRHVVIRWYHSGRRLRKQFGSFRYLVFFFIPLLTVLLHSQVVRKRLWRGEATSSPYHIVGNLGLAVDDSLLSADQTVQASHGGACKEEKKRQLMTTAECRQRKQTGAVGETVDGTVRCCRSTATTKLFLSLGTVRGLSKPAWQWRYIFQQRPSLWDVVCIQPGYLSEH